MKKQVVAIILVMVLVITTFAACGKKYKMFTDKDGIKHPMVTDAEGNTVRNPDGNIAVYQTDKNGEVVTDKDGKDVINGIRFPDYIVDGQLIEMKDFKLELSKEWVIEGKEAKRKDSTIIMTFELRDTLTFNDALKANTDGFQDSADGKIKVEKSEEQAAIPGMEKTARQKIIITNSEMPEEGMYIENYVFQINSRVYQLGFICNEKDKDLMDFATIFEAIKVR
ncbi:MAG: hypothetical protein RR229_04555 [Oscillospiraceae bacterium]